MRLLQAALLAVLIVAVSAVAFELHRIANFLSPYGYVGSAVLNSLTTPSTETRAQRNKRLQRETLENIEDAKAILETPTPSGRRSATRPTPKTP